MPNIFLIGKAGSGKDTVAEYLQGVHGYKLYALATPIKEEYKRFFPRLNPRQDRDKLIQIGQTYKELYGMEVWIKLTHGRISLDNVSNVCITDGRYAVEYDYFANKLGYVPIRIVCNDEIRLQRLKRRDGSAQEEALKKESTELDEVFAHPLLNESTLEQLIQNIEETFTKINN